MDAVRVDIMRLFFKYYSKNMLPSSSCCFQRERNMLYGALLAARCDVYVDSVYSVWGACSARSVEVATACWYCNKDAVC